MKLDRLMGIVTLLLRQERLTAPQLAARFEVTPRTIRRDIDTLCQAGIPITTLQGRGGGIALMAGYTLDKSLFTAQELQTILAGLQGLASVSPAQSVQAIWDKLHDSTKLDDGCFVIDLASHYQDSLSGKIATIRKAIMGRTLLSFSYYTETGTMHRTAEPYRLLFKWSSWYLFAYCVNRQDFRMFKLGRLWQLVPLPDTFTPRVFDPKLLTFADYFAQENFHLTALFDACCAHRLIEEYGLDCFAVQADGRLRFVRAFASYDNMAQWVLSFGAGVEVLEPQALRRDLGQQAQKILDYYAKQDK